MERARLCHRGEADAALSVYLLSFFSSSNGFYKEGRIDTAASSSFFGDCIAGVFLATTGFLFFYLDAAAALGTKSSSSLGVSDSRSLH